MSFIKQVVIFCVISVYSINTDSDLYYKSHKVDRKCLLEYFLHSRSWSSASANCRRSGYEHNSTDAEENLLLGYKSLIRDIEIRTEKSREDMDTIVSQIKLLMKNEADKAVNYMTVYLEQTSLYFQVIIHDRKPHNGTHCKENIMKQLGESLQLADENVTLCLALGYQRVQKLPDKLTIHFETLDNLKKFSNSKFRECTKYLSSGGNCSHESLDLERTVFIYETSPFPVVMAEIAIHGFKEVSDLSVCLKDIISRMMSHSVKVIGDFNKCIHNVEMPKLKYLLKFMKKYV